jgi:2-polyprenyl-6-methoxyphenol hydroxylase-like FAD-dependent oxidoreductase
MARIIVVGAGVGGLTSAMLLARDGHDVKVLERDPLPPPGSADDAWEHWERRGVNQFRMIHIFLPRFRALLEAELPHAAREFENVGAIRYNPIEAAPAEVTGGMHPGDEQFEALTARRPVAETALVRAAEASERLQIRRGVAVAALRTGTSAADGVPHVVGVRTDTGEDVDADLVIDATGRRSSLPSLLAEIGARAPEEELEDSGFMYYGRHFRAADGEIPPAMCGLLTPWGTVSTLTLPCDNGTWGLGIITSAKDAALRPLKDVDTWMRTWRSYPLVAHWVDAEPVDGGDVAIMAKIPDRHRDFVVDGTPVATGVVAVADSWACTNPSLGRGCSIGFMHAVALRDLLRDRSLDDPIGLVSAWHDATQRTVEPYYRATLAFDRHRLAEIDAGIEGKEYDPGDPEFEITQALQHAALQDPDILRAFLKIAGVLELPADVLAAPGIFEKVAELGAGWRAAQAEMPAPNREQLVAIVAA